MEFAKGYLYHVYNRGNNRGLIYYTTSNYRFFLEKVDYYVVPYADILGWCLMPNHFHLMIEVHRENIFSVTLNQSMGRMLSSYARAINQQENRTGSLFQQHTKAICLNGQSRLTPSWYKLFGATKINAYVDNQDYPRICLDYIHMNPVKAGIVLDPKSWRWSSYHQIFLQDKRDELVNLEKLKNVVRL